MEKPTSSVAKPAGDGELPERGACNELREHGAEGERRGEARSMSAAPRVSSASAAPKVAAKAARQLTTQVMTTNAENSRKMAAEAAR